MCVITSLSSSNLFEYLCSLLISFLLGLFREEFNLFQKSSMSLYPLIESGTLPVSPCIAMLGHNFDKPRIYFKAFLSIMSPLELLELLNKSFSVNVLRPLSFSMLHPFFLNSNSMYFIFNSLDENVSVFFYLMGNFI